MIYRQNVTSGETTDYLRLGSRTIARLATTGGSTTATYTYGDHLGSPAAAANAWGGLVWREDYTPFGEARQQPAANDNGESYTGHITDTNTGLVYMQARYYDPAIGRFLSNDPVGFAEGGPGYFNRYAYVMNNPFNLIDPTGEAADCEMMGTCPPGSGRVGESVNYCNANTCSQSQRDQVAAERDAFEDMFGPRATLSMASNPELDGDRVRGPEGVTDEEFADLKRGVWVESAFRIGGAVLGGAAGRAIRPQGVPHSWRSRPARRGEGVRYSDPNNSHNSVRVMRGNPGSPYQNSRSPYVRVQSDRGALDRNGNVVPTNSPDAHIPLRDFRFDPGWFE